MDKKTFGFITPKSLRNNITESIEFAGWLWILAQKVEPKYQDEMVRTIVLYNIGVIEALLLFRAKRQKIKFFEDLYPHATCLPEPFQKTDYELIISYRHKKEKNESRIWLNELIKEQKLFLDSLHDEIVNLQNIRNSFHLSKPRSGLSLERASISFDIVLKLAMSIQKEILKNK
jgi:hypothetical protein